MSVTGKVQNGVVVLPNGIILPEGTQVTVLTPADMDPIANKIQKLVKERSHLPTDYALNHGHYVAGEPKK